MESSAPVAPDRKRFMTRFLSHRPCTLFIVGLALLLLNGCAIPHGAAARSGTASPPAVSTHAVSTPAVPPAATPPPRSGPHLLSFSLGAGYWPGLGDIDPTSSGFSSDDFGDFEEWGGTFGLGYHHRVAQFEHGDLWLGGDFSVSAFENERSFDVLTLPSGNTIDGSFSANLIRLTPSATYRISFAERVTGFVGGGFGLYATELVEEFDGFSDDIDSDSAFGAFLNWGIDFGIGDSPFSIRLEEQIHFVELDAFDRTIPADSTVDGPIHQFLFGVSLQL